MCCGHKVDTCRALLDPFWTQAMVSWALAMVSWCHGQWSELNHFSNLSEELNCVKGFANFPALHSFLAL